MKGKYLLRVLFKDFFELTRSKASRGFLHVCLKIGDMKRFKEGRLNLGNRQIRFTDNWSLIWQYFEIYSKRYYYFQTDKSKPVIFDCGANIGLATLFFLDNYSHPEIYAFEPDPKIASIFKENLKNKSGVHFIEKAVWIHSNGIKMVQEGSDGGFLSEDQGNLQVETIRLRDELRKHEEIDLLKIDIEGAEHEVIEDCQSELHRVKNIFLEYHSVKGKNQSLSRLLSYLEMNGFEYYIINEDRYHTSPLSREVNFKSKPFDLQLNIFANRRN